MDRQRYIGEEFLEEVANETRNMTHAELLEWLKKQDRVILQAIADQRANPQETSDRIQLLNPSYQGKDPTMKRFSLCEIDNAESLTTEEE